MKLHNNKTLDFWSRAVLLLIFLFAGVFSNAFGAPDHKPNIIMFLVDDMGWMDSTPYGSRYYDTPNMERFSKRAMLFTDAYAMPLCSPTRASILTGKYSARHGITTASGHREPQPAGFKFMPDRAAQNRSYVEPISKNYLDPSEFTLAKALRAAGYRTGHFGKWHLGINEEHWPERYGFDIAFHGHPDPGPRSYFSPYQFKLSQSFKDGPPGEYITDRVTDDAIQFIEDNRERPFLLHLWHYGVHGPWGHKEEITKTFAGKKDPRGKQGNPIMASMLKSIDESLGRVLDTLEKLKLDGNTIVIFYSDNGGNTHSNMPDDPAMTNIKPGHPQWAAKQDWRKLAGDQPPTNNDPLRAGKGTLYEGGIRVPLMVRWPGVVKDGSRSSEVVHAIDMYPTILDMVGIARPRQQILDGVSFVPALKQMGTVQREALFNYFPHRGKTLPPGVAVRQGNWKLIRWFEPGPDAPVRHELFNLRDDIGESKNLAVENPGKVKELDSLIDGFLKETSALVPKLNPAFTGIPLSVPAKKPAAQERELIRDNHFHGGFILLDPKPGKRVPYGTIRGLKSNEEPVWEMAQWTSRFPLKVGPPLRPETNMIAYTNAGKSVTLGKRNSDKGDLSLAVNGSVEYDGKLRQKGDPWVHLLIAQKFEGPPALSDLRSARLHLEARLLKSQRIEAEGYSPKIHAAQFLMFLQVQNMNPNSSGKGNFLWFGIPIYDDRHPMPKEHKAQDTGTKKFIFTPGGGTYTSESAHDGKWITIDKDLLPLMREGLDTAWARDFLIESKELSDYKITGMNIGWEVPGIFDVEMQVRNLSLKVK